MVIRLVYVIIQTSTDILNTKDPCQRVEPRRQDPNTWDRYCAELRGAAAAACAALSGLARGQSSSGDFSRGGP